MNNKNYLEGIKDGIPIAMGYFAVAFTLGIAAKDMGMTIAQSGLMSFMLHASAGQFAAMTVIAEQAGYIAMIGAMFVINIRYFLMSCALSQKLNPNTPLWKKMLMSYFVTDEIFGMSSQRRPKPILPSWCHVRRLSRLAHRYHAGLCRGKYSSRQSLQRLWGSTLWYVYCGNYSTIKGKPYHCYCRYHFHGCKCFVNCITRSQYHVFRHKNYHFNAGNRICCCNHQTSSAGKFFKKGG